MASTAGRGEATDRACCEFVKLSNIVKVLNSLCMFLYVNGQRSFSIVSISINAHT